MGVYAVIKPYQVAMQKDGSVRYEFKPEHDPDEKRAGAYHVRGSVAWPILNDVTGVSEGFIICAAQHIRSGVVIIFSQMPFTCIDHILDDTGKIMHTGISSWLNNCYAKYLCFTYYHSGADETHRLYLIQTLRSKMIQPAPCFPEVPLPDHADAENVLFTWRTQQKIVMDASSQLHTDLLTWENTGRKRKMASVEAMLTLVNGYHKYPFVKRTMEDDDDGFSDQD